jgi:hypothetical protein
LSGGGDEKQVRGKYKKSVLQLHSQEQDKARQFSDLVPEANDSHRKPAIRMSFLPGTGKEKPPC